LFNGQTIDEASKVTTIRLKCICDVCMNSFFMYIDCDDSLDAMDIQKPYVYTTYIYWVGILKKLDIELLKKSLTCFESIFDN